MTENIKATNLNGIFILLVDDDTTSLRNLKGSLQELGAKVRLAGNIARAHQVISQKLVHTMIVEASLKDGSGFELIQHFKALYPSGQFYLMSSPSVIESIRQLKVEGIDGFFTKPLDIGLLSSHIAENSQINTTSISKLDPLTELLRPYLIFRSPIMRRGLMVLPKLAASNHSVLITGETGTGKEMVARAIHGLSPFANGPFVAVNCSAIPESLIEGELFGHEKGSFTGAQAQHRGKFELARNGTLFLDEIGEMPLSLQARLLRVLEERQFYRVGGEKPISINLRIVAATQVNLEEAVEDRLFREDLYYRLNVLRVHLPALKDRIEDIPLLAWHFLERAFMELNRQKPFPVLTTETIDTLIRQPWKGNVRELKNIMTRLAVLLPSNVIQISPDFLTAYFPEKLNVNQKINPQQDYQIEEQQADLVEETKNSNIIEIASIPTDEGVFIPIGTTLKDAEEMLIQKTLKMTDGNRTRAAKILGIGIRTIRRKVNEER
ncbi:sigma-54 dependent transcriptional regulator [bacterium]|nr:sigma-54 dependent transcriptional regulator [bacterium]